jgi:hypothetical protein
MLPLTPGIPRLMLWCFFIQKFLKPASHMDFKLTSKPRSLSIVLSISEAMSIISKIERAHELVVKMMYGCGFRVS